MTFTLSNASNVIPSNAIAVNVLGILDGMTEIYASQYLPTHLSAQMIFDWQSLA
jgi:Na+-transporting methylmalonyl-CoA/oxaloacetate decarboxylase beta subunit